MCSRLVCRNGTRFSGREYESCYSSVSARLAARRDAVSPMRPSFLHWRILCHIGTKAMSKDDNASRDDDRKRMERRKGKNGSGGERCEKEGGVW